MMLITIKQVELSKIFIENTNAFDLQVTDITGRNIATQFEKTNNGYLFNMQNQSAGLYFIRNAKTGQAVKFVKE